MQPLDDSLLTFQQITLRSSTENQVANRFTKIAAKGMYSSVLLERQRHFLVWSTVNLSAPILVLKSDSVALEVEDFQMTEHMSVLKVADSLTTSADSLYTFNFETKTLRAFQE